MADAVEILITNAIHTAFIKYPEGDGGPNLDYEWIAPDQSTHIAKAILLDLAANGFQIVKKHTVEPASARGQYPAAVGVGAGPRSQKQKDADQQTCCKCPEA